MKRVIKTSTLLILLLTVMLALVACSSDDGTPSGMKKASGEEADFTLYVPADWTVDLKTAAVSAYCSKEDPSSVSCMAWELTNTDTTLDEWWEMNLEENLKVFESVDVISSEDMTVSGLYAKKYEYTVMLGENEYRILQVAVIKGINVYLFTYTSLPEKYDSHIEEVKSVISNLKIG